ncbi:MAG: hypothetical protein WC450_11550, partial [Candidatus Omnitrophota bacterium]
MLAPSATFAPVLLKGMTIDPENPLKFDFIIDSGNTKFSIDQVKKESEKLVKYFLASMTIPKDDLWVNLSPYGNERIIPDELGKTELGRDMLAQDYILKQLTASLMYPEKELGKKFWDKIYQKAQEQFETSEIPVNTFNKVWILPESATVYEHEQTVYVVNARLKVMLDSDYVAMESHQDSTATPYASAEGRAMQDADVGAQNSVPVQNDLSVSSQIIKEIIIPEIEREVNEGEHFAPLRQIYHSLILAKWYKETVKSSLLNQVYADKNLIDGIRLEDGRSKIEEGSNERSVIDHQSSIVDQIYDQYMEAYKKGVFNYIKEDYDRLSNETIPRKYFSGGEEMQNIPLKRTSRPITESDNPKFKARVEVIAQKPARSSSPVSTKHEKMIMSRIDTLIGELNRRGVRPTVHGSDLRVFRDNQSLIKHIQKYTVLEEIEDIRRILEGKLNITPSGQFGAESEPPLWLSQETVGDPFQAAEILYNAIFDQNKFLASNAEKPLNVVLFRRERGGQKLTNLLTILPNVNVKVIVGGVDDEQSWREPARIFATGIPTIGKVLLDLARDPVVRNFLDSRIDNENEIRALIDGLQEKNDVVLKSENMQAINEKGHSIADPLDWTDKESRLMKLANYIEEFYNLWEEKGRPFSLNDIPLRSMALVGAAYKHAANGKPQWQKAIDEIGKMLQLDPGDRVILPTEERQHLITLRSDGVVHFSAESLTYFNSQLPVVGMWLVKGDDQPFNIDRFINTLKTEGSVDFQKLASQEISVYNGTKGRAKITKTDIQETTRKVPKDQVKEVAAAIGRVSSTQGENLIGITEEARDAIKNADAIVYSNVLLQRDLAPILIVPGLRQAIKEATDAVKINLGVIRRALPTRENEILKKVKHIYRYLRNVEGERTVQLDEKVGQYIEYVLDSYLQEGDENRIYRMLEPIKKQTKGKVSTIVLKVQFDESQVFSSELLGAIIALVGIKKAGFKVVDGGKDSGKLVLSKLSGDQRAWKN